MGKDAIKEPFAVINADDFYGKESYQILADFLKSVDGKKNEYCMVGYRVGNTLSESGAVSRGICGIDENDLLQNVVERTHIEKKNDQIVSPRHSRWRRTLRTAGFFFSMSGSVSSSARP
jgi:folate-dependent tRNA-U54 methylase TrmFO/GidA